MADAVALLRPDLPSPLLPPRGGTERLADGRWRFTFLNRSRDLGWPLDWSVAGGTPADQLWQMNLHYMEYLEGLDDHDFGAFVADWIQRNRPYGPGYWRDAWNSYTVSIRIVVWLQQLACRQERLDEALVAAMAASLVEQLDFLVLHLERDLGGNHLIKNIKALHVGARYFHEPLASRWRRIAEPLLARELEEQILPDGVHFERSPSYHGQVFADLIECQAALAEGAARDRLTDVLHRMAAATSALAHPDGKVALFNDAGLSMAYAPQACLAAYRRVTGGTVTEPRPIRLPDAGYFGVRAEGAYVLVDCGRVAPDHLMAHGHADMLSFEWSLAGERLIVDPGVCEYVEGERRRYARSVASHNTVTIGDAEPCDFFGAFRCGRRANVQVLICETTPDGGLVLEGTHDGYDHLPGRPRHRRRFTIGAGADAIEILDRIEGGDGTGTAHFLLHPALEVRLEGDRARLHGKGVVAELVAEAPVILDPDAHWSPDMGLWLPATRLRIPFRTAHRTLLRRC
jgi:uncharacterized heparinase superfamily protein